MSKIVVCDHKVPDLMQTVKDALEFAGHTVVILSDEDPTEIFHGIKREQPMPDVAIVDLVKEPDDFKLPIAEWWGCKLVAMLRADPETEKMRIIARSRYPTTETRAYLQTHFAIDPDDIQSAYTFPLTRLIKVV